jgi:hypothetical protein
VRLKNFFNLKNALAYMYKAGVVDENKSVVGLAPDSTNRLN